MPNYYDWNKTLAYDADITMVVGSRGIGKTYGIRKQCVRDFIRHEDRFTEIVRFKNEISGVSGGYFDRLESNEEFPDYIFMTNNNLAFIADKPTHNEKPDWELIGYFVAMSQAQQLKKHTFNKVKRFIFDEAILDKTDRFHHYLPREVSILANLIDTISRERADTEGTKPRAYLLGNALDVMNPYFVHYDVGVPKKGFKWYGNKTMLLHYAEDAEYSQEKSTKTVAGRMLAGTEDGAIANQNTFARISDDFIMQKTSTAKFMFGVFYNGSTFGIWEDWRSGLYFVTKKIPNNTDKPIYALTLDDNKFNYVSARRAEAPLRYMAELHYIGCVRYQTIAIRERFKEVLKLFGVR